MILIKHPLNLIIKKKIPVEVKIKVKVHKKKEVHPNH
jgi:hypothetical protein